MKGFEAPKELSEDDIVKKEEVSSDIESVEDKSYEDIANDALEEIINELDEDVRKYYEEHKEQISESHKRMQENFIQTLSKIEGDKLNPALESIRKFDMESALDTFKSGVKNSVTKSYRFRKKHS